MDGVAVAVSAPPAATAWPAIAALVRSQFFKVLVMDSA